MGKIDLGHARRPTRARVGGNYADRAARFRDRFPPTAKRRLFIRNHVLGPNRTPPINPERTEIRDAAALTDEIKATVRTMGADIVGVADFDHRFAVTQAGEITHRHADVDANFNWQPWCRRLRERSLPPVGRRSEGVERHSLEVLYDGGEMELITRAGKSAQSHALEAMMIFEVSKAHLDALAFVA